MSNTYSDTFLNGRRVYTITCRYCGVPDIVLGYERISDNIDGSPRYRYIARNQSGSIHNCINRTSD